MSKAQDDGEAGDMRAWIRERVEAHIDLEDPSYQFNPWSSKYHVRQDIQYGEYGRDAVIEEIEAMVAEDVFIYWNGWIAPRRPDVLKAIIEAERASTIPRKILVGKCNQALRDLESEEVAADV